MARDDSVLPAGHRFSHYRVQRVLGRGGFGVTYLAIDERGGRQVAVKEFFPGECAVRRDGQVLARPGAEHENAFRWGLKRFRDEGRVLARFDHPHLVRVIGDFEAHGTGYIVMAYVEGKTLSTRLAREGTLDEARSLALVLPIVDGLEQVHAADYLHRDIKPGNIVIGADGSPVLLDFGAARRALGDRTRSLTAIVSDGYAPIEQYARDSRQGPWTDIYALGAVLYRCLTGQPVPEAPARATADELVPLGEAAPAPPSQAIQEAVHAALAVNGRDRPQSLAEWREMLSASPAAPAKDNVAERNVAERDAGGAAADDVAEHDIGGATARDVVERDTGGATAGPAPEARREYADDLAGQRQRLVDWVRHQLVGPTDPDEIHGSPVERFPIGVLHPINPDGSGATGVDPAEPEVNPDSRGSGAAASSPDGADLTAPPADDEDDESHDGDEGGSRSEVARPVGRRRYAPPSSVGVSFYVRGEAQLRISASAASYRRVTNRGESGRYQRQTPDSDAVGAGRTPDSAGRRRDERGAGTAPTSFDAEARAPEDAAPGGGARYQRTAIECGLLWPSGEGETPTGVERDVRRRPYRGGDALTAAFSQAEAVGWKTQLDVRRRPYGDGHILTVVFANRQREAPPGTERAHRRLFEVQLECEVEAGELTEYPRVDPALLTDEEQEIELQHRHRPIYAIGHGVAAEWSIAGRRRPRIWTDCMPTVEVPVVTQEIPDLDPDLLVLLDLAEAPAGTVLARLETFVNRYGEWVDGQRASAESFVGGEGEAARRICARMDAASERMRGGVARLRRSDEALEAFRLANRAMFDQMCQDRVQKKLDSSSDEGFDHQVNRVREERDVRRYRWRPFQLAFLLAVIESTIDEADPCRGVLDLIWFPAGGGKTEAYLGLFAFLAMWRRLRYGEDGGGVAVLMRYTLRLLTRQQFERAARIVCALELLRRRDEARLGVEPVSVGLWVGGAASPNTHEEAAAKVADMVEAGSAAGAHDLVLQACPWCGRPFNAPDSYRTGPAEFHFLCRNSACDFGTGEPLPCNVVDEALYERPPTLLVGTIDKFARLAWEERAAAFFGRGGRRPPELVIQDELHLIAGPLGSVAGLYEAAIETVLERRGARPKYVASTATIRMAREQVERLYGRTIAVFPPPGLSADDSWFARNDVAQPGRLYIGHLAPGLDQQHCLAPLAATLLAAPPILFADQRDAADLLDAWWTLVVYHGSLRGVGTSHIAFETDVRDFLRRLEAERRQATREGREPDTPGGGRDEARGEPVVAQLTSQSSPQENARTFDKLAARRSAADCLDAVLATNMISVGVDVDRLAVMVVNGQPFTTAEYIQASSRIGRALVPGLVFANYYRHQARSLSHYENFRPYHESFYRFVEPTSVTPFTYQVRKRALHAALVIALRHGCQDWRPNDAAARFDPDHAGAKAVVEALKQRCRKAAGAAGDETAAHLDRLVGEWRDEAARCKSECRGLQYHCRDKSQDSLLVAFDRAERGCWKTLHSMRNVEDTAVLQAERLARHGTSGSGVREAWRDGR